ncbi:glutathione S-transferase [Aspergillus melleus]|uniref:glutathione S-transferase n=1 Tax=Aspergillus melleus TaxID=138277 RepID=UPI001E8EC90B|nr:bifunctional glutathione transferase/peroxidase [Aspergillus melleus]KAH8433471.1 bifunctional glutathione transferase/peroxidase [Aspergillus melleus]
MADANNGAKITLYWLEKSRSQRILWLLEELGVSYELKTFKRGSDMLAPPELKKIHPLGKSPVITIETEHTDKPLVLAESGAISEYLCDHFDSAGKLVPKRYAEGKEGQVGGESEEWMRFRYFMHYAEGTLMPFLVFKLVMDTVKNAPGMPFFIKPIPRLVASKVEEMFVLPNVNANFTFLEERLKTAPDGGPFLCGKQLTAADIMMSFPVIAAASRVPLKEQYPKLQEYVDRLQQEEGYKKAVAKVVEVDGKFDASL